MRVHRIRKDIDNDLKKEAIKWLKDHYPHFDNTDRHIILENSAKSNVRLTKEFILKTNMKSYHENEKYNDESTLLLYKRKIDGLWQLYNCSADDSNTLIFQNNITDKVLSNTHACKDLPIYILYEDFSNSEPKPKSKSKSKSYEKWSDMRERALMFPLTPEECFERPLIRRFRK
jgi:hypothetical protein